LEALASPAIAAALVTVITFHALFASTAAGFMVSALLVLSVRLPSPQPSPDRGWLARAKVGFVVFARTPRLRGLMALNLAVPRLLDRVSDRSVMLAGGVVAPLVLAALAVLPPRWSTLLIAWSLIGLCYGALLTPTGRLLRRSAAARDRPGLFAAQFALSHAAWLVTYPLAGWTATHGGLAMAFVLHGAIGLAAVLTAALLWPARDPVTIEHDHDLPPDHPHLASGALRHSHPYVIDVLHPRWPRRR
jgi:hypothetical protein